MPHQKAVRTSTELSPVEPKELPIQGTDTGFFARTLGAPAPWLKVYIGFDGREINRTDFKIYDIYDYDIRYI